MSISKSKILKVYPYLLFLKNNNNGEVESGDALIFSLNQIKKILKLEEKNISETLQSLLKPLIKPHFKSFIVWWVSWKIPFIKVKLLKENMADLLSLDYAMATIFFIMYNTAANAETPNYALVHKMHSQFLGHVIKPIINLSDEARYKIASKIIKNQVLARYISDYYAESLERIMKLYPDVFEPDSKNVSLFQNGEGCIAMLEDIATTGLYGDFDKVSKLPVHTLFMYLKHQAIKVKSEEK